MKQEEPGLNNWSYPDTPFLGKTFKGRRLARMENAEECLNIPPLHDETTGLGRVAHTWNSSTWQTEAEAGRECWRPAWAT